MKTETYVRRKIAELTTADVRKVFGCLFTDYGRTLNQGFSASVPRHDIRGSTIDEVAKVFMIGN